MTLGGSDECIVIIGIFFESGYLGDKIEAKEINREQVN
jgi:hypothetical protein